MKQSLKSPVILKNYVTNALSYAPSQSSELSKGSQTYSFIIYKKRGRLSREGAKPPLLFSSPFPLIISKGRGPEG